MTLGEASFLVNIAGFMPYAKGIIWGNVRPERTSWFIWSVILGLSVVGYRELGATESLWFVLGDFSATFMIFVLSLFKGRGGLTVFDTRCLAVALVGVLFWQISDNNPVFIFAGALTADVMGLLPTLKKSLQDPESESASTYMFSCVASAMGFIAVATWNWSLMIYPIYLFLANGITAQLIIVGQYHLRRLKVMSA